MGFWHLVRNNLPFWLDGRLNGAYRNEKSRQLDATGQALGTEAEKQGEASTCVRYWNNNGDDLCSTTVTLTLRKMS